MKNTLTALALLVAVAAPSMGSAMGCNTCPAPAPTCCAPAPAPVCMQPVCQTCTCCQKVLGFWDRGGNTGAWGSY